MKKNTELYGDRMKSALLDLTWKKMKEWADPGSVERGRGYLDNVEEPRQYPDGSVIAEVHGSEDYHTRFHIDDDGKLQGDCTCPVGYRCKHAVALALVAIKKFKAGEEMRRGATDDSLWKCAMSELAAWEPMDEDDDDDDDFGEEDFDDSEGDDKFGMGVNDIENPDDQVLSFLAGLDEHRLRETVEELVKEVREVRPYLQHKLDVARASIAQIAEMAREAINDASADWYDKYDKHGHNVVPDYSLVKEYFGILSASGHWKDLMKLGEILKRRSFRQIAESLHEYGEIRDQVCACMDIVVEAVMRAGAQDPLEKLVWYEQLRSKDDYSVLEGMEKNFATSLETDRAGWAKVASYALDRYAKGGEGWELYPIRDVCLALERAGRVDEAVSRLRDNLRDDKNWIPLVEILERNGRRDEALKLCRAGISSRRDEAGSAVYKLREKIRLMTCDGDDGKTSSWIPTGLMPPNIALCAKSASGSMSGNVYTSSSCGIFLPDAIWPQRKDGPCRRPEHRPRTTGLRDIPSLRCSFRLRWKTGGPRTHWPGTASRCRGAAVFANTNSTSWAGRLPMRLLTASQRKRLRSGWAMSTAMSGSPAIRTTTRSGAPCRSCCRSCARSEDWTSGEPRCLA